jgi:hypothetical protein
MAVTIKLPFFEDQTSVTVAGYSEAGSLLQSGVTLTESAVPGLYTGSLAFATFPVGYYDMRVYIGAATVASASWSIRVTADGTTADYADSIGELRRWATNQTEHDATQAAVASLASTGTVTVVSPVDTTGNIVGAIIIGDDYLAANSRAFSWTIPAITGITAGTATASFGGAKGTETWLVTGTITVDGANWVLSFDLPRTATQDLEPGYYAWSVEVASVSGTEVTRVRSGRMVQLVEKQT